MKNLLLVFLLLPFTLKAQVFDYRGLPQGPTLIGTEVVPSTTAKGTTVKYSLNQIATFVGGTIGGNPFADNTDLFKNSSDATKLIRFNLSGLTTGTTRTWTFPNANGTFLYQEGLGTNWSTALGASLGSGWTTALNTIGFTNQRITSQSGTISWVNDPKLVLGNYQTLHVFGDSFTAGTGASPSTADYKNILQSSLGSAILTNHAVSGVGWYNQSTNAYTNISVGNQSPIVVMVGLNDIRRNGSANSTIEKIKGGCRALIANSFLASAVAANDAAVTTTGTWTTTSGIGDKASNNLSGLVRKSSASGSTLTWTFSGQSLVIGTFNTDQSVTVSGDWTYAIDGGTAVTFTGKNKTDGVSDGLNNNSITPNVVVVTGLGNSSHTVVVTASETNSTYIDFFGTLAASVNCSPVIINSIPYLTSAGYAISPSSGSVAASNTASAALLSVVNEFPYYPVFYNEVNDYYNLATGVSGDNIHPNNTGYQQLANSILAIIKPVLVQQNPITVFNSTSTINAYIGNTASQTILSVARNPVSGVFSNTGVAASDILLAASNGASSITLRTTGTNNSAPTTRVTINANGVTTFNQSIISSGSGAQFQGALSSPSGLGWEFEYNSGTAYATAINRTGSVWQPIIVRGSTVSLQSSGTTTFQSTSATSLTVTDAVNVILGSTTGTKIGTSTSQKIGFFNATPIVQPANTVNIDDVLVNTGLRASGGTSGFTTSILPRAETTSANSEPIRFTVPAAQTSTPVSQAFGPSTTGDVLTYVIATGAARKNIIMDDGTLLTSGRVAVATTNGRLTNFSSFLFDTTNGLQALGTTTNNNASAGNIGEYVSSLIASGSAVSLTTATAANVTSISLTAGDWDVSGNVNYTETASTVTSRSAGLSSTSATLPTDGSEAYCGVQSTVTSETNSISLPKKRFSLASTQTIYLVASATFSAGTCAGFGAITARRVR